MMQVHIYDIKWHLNPRLRESLQLATPHLVEDIGL